MGAASSSQEPLWYRSLQSDGIEGKKRAANNAIKRMEEEKLRHERKLAEEREQEEKEEIAAYYDRMEELIKSQDHKKLRVIVQKFQERFEKTSDDQILKIALNFLAFVDARDDLLNAIREGKYEQLSETIKRVEEGGSSQLMPTLLAEAKEFLKTLDRIRNLGRRVLKLEGKTLHEMKMLRHPPPVVHHVLMAALLLLDQHELRTKTWKKCQKYISAYGVKSFVKRARDFNPLHLHPEIWARARKILQPYDMDAVTHSSAGAAIIYEWVSGIIQECHEHCSASKPKAASIDRQMEIFEATDSRDDFAFYWHTASNVAGPAR